MIKMPIAFPADLTDTFGEPAVHVAKEGIHAVVKLIGKHEERIVQALCVGAFLAGAAMTLKAGGK